MQLSSFIIDLLAFGDVTVAGQITPFEEKDIEKSTALLQQFYEKDILEMPGKAPAFSQDAALWAAKFLYNAIQLTMMRDLSEEDIQKNLEPFLGTQSVESIYSIDLTFRFLPDLFSLAKGLAPEDILVDRLKETASKFPLSTIGIEINEDADHTLILNHPSLRLNYTDRLIEAKDLMRVKRFGLEELIDEALGDYAAVLWKSYFDSKQVIL